MPFTFVSCQIQSLDKKALGRVLYYGSGASKTSKPYAKWLSAVRRADHITATGNVNENQSSECSCLCPHCGVDACYVRGRPGLATTDQPISDRQPFGRFRNQSRRASEPARPSLRLCNRPRGLGGHHRL